MKSPLRIISSMATRPWLEELTAKYAVAGDAVRLESVGGVEASRRLAAGERFDAAILAGAAIGRLIDAGRLRADSRVDLARSAVAVAVAAGAARPDIGSEDGLRRAVLAAPAIGYSTGPSGEALAALFERWGIGGEIADRLRIPPPGVAVGSLLQSGEIGLGFQQLSELMALDGVELLGPLPPSVAIETVFSGGVCSAGDRPQAAARLLAFLASAETADCKRRHGMEPA